MSNPKTPSQEERVPEKKRQRDRSPLDRGYDKKLDGPDRPST